jgi:hypothetical protein
MMLTALALLVQYPCGIDRLAAVKGGATISFTYRYPASILKPSGDRRKARIGPRALRLRTGETLVIRGVHSGCSLNLIVRDGRLGVETLAWSSEPGQEYQEKVLFVPVPGAQRR